MIDVAYVVYDLKTNDTSIISKTMLLPIHSSCGHSPRYQRLQLVQSVRVASSWTPGQIPLIWSISLGSYATWLDFFATKPGRCWWVEIWGYDAAEAIIEEVETADPWEKCSHGCSIGGFGCRLESNHKYHPYLYLYTSISQECFYLVDETGVWRSWSKQKILRSKTRCPCISWFFHLLLQLPRRCSKHHGFLITLKSQPWVEACGMASMEQVRL